MFTPKQFRKFSTVREALLYRRLRSSKVQCLLCERKCVLEEKQTGFCGTRVNVEGKLYTLVYGDLSAIESRPIEIKPFFHFWPGSKALTVSTWSCNFKCPWCQNFQLSATLPNPLKAFFLPPREIVKEALLRGDQGLCVSFQEPTLFFEASIETFKLARENKLYNTFVSNGYMSLEALNMLADSGLNGIKIDVKGDEEVYRKYCGGVNVDFVWRNIKEAKRKGLHVEVVHLVVTGLNDKEEKIIGLVEKHLRFAGSETPLHFTRYFPAYKFKQPPTSIKFLEKAYKIAKREGVKFPYLGNVPGHKYENTYCPNCGELLIKRWNVKILRYNLSKGNKCPRCGEKVPMTGKYVSNKFSFH